MIVGKNGQTYEYAEDAYNDGQITIEEYRRYLEDPSYKPKANINYNDIPKNSSEPYSKTTINTGAKVLGSGVFNENSKIYKTTDAVFKDQYNKLNTVKELTGYQTSEVKYSISKILTNNYPFIRYMCQDLRKLGLYSYADTTRYVPALATAVKEFKQKYMGISNNSIINDEFIKALKSEANKTASDTINTTGNTDVPGNVGEDGDTYEAYLDSTDSDRTDNIGAHYGQFFSEQNSKQFRQNKRDIRIVLGDGTVTKVIKEVYMRSVGTDVDASGNPISETYEFIAKDITETDNPEDVNGYSAFGEDFDQIEYTPKTNFSGYTE